MSAVTKQEIVEALRSAQNGLSENQIIYDKYSGLAERIEKHGIAPPDGMVLVPKEPVCWAITGDGKLDADCVGEIFVYSQETVKCLTARGYVATPLYAAPEVKP